MRGRAVRKRGKLVTYFAFDLLFLNGRDLRALPLLERQTHCANYEAKTRRASDTSITSRRRAS
jgi:ATP-dependent DNA ligase